MTARPMRELLQGVTVRHHPVQLQRQLQRQRLRLKLLQKVTHAKRFYNTKTYTKILRLAVASMKFRRESKRDRNLAIYLYVFRIDI